MTVTLYSITPPTIHTTRYLLRPTVLVAPPPRTDILDDIDSMYDQHPENTGPSLPDIKGNPPLWHADWSLESDAVSVDLEKSAEITRFP